MNDPDKIRFEHQTSYDPECPVIERHRVIVRWRDMEWVSPVLNSPSHPLIDGSDPLREWLLKVVEPEIDLIKNKKTTPPTIPSRRFDFT